MATAFIFSCSWQQLLLQLMVSCTCTIASNTYSYNISYAWFICIARIFGLRYETTNSFETVRFTWNSGVSCSGPFTLNCSTNGFNSDEHEIIVRDFSPVERSQRVCEYSLFGFRANSEYTCILEHNTDTCCSFGCCGNGCCIQIDAVTTLQNCMHSTS